jgi:hypothetical protein
MKRPSPIPLAALAATSLALGLTACSGDPEPTPTVTVTQTVAPSPSPDEQDGQQTPEPTLTPDESTGPLPDVGPDDQAPFVANTLPDTSATSSGALLSPTDLRFGKHDGYDRLVLDLKGNGQPGWRAEYVTDPTQQAAGEPVYLVGGAYLMILVQGMIYPTEPGALPYEGPTRITPTGSEGIKDVVFGSLFEGTQEIFVGVASKEPFRVFLLENPTRIVIDVQHP